MDASEFEKQPRGPFRIDVYHHPTAVPSTLGDFTVELRMAVGDTDPPDQAMIEYVTRLISRFNADQSRITELVFQRYLAVCDDPDWLEDCEIPLGLAADELSPFLEARTLSVVRDRDDTIEPYAARLSLSPQWDEEHGLCFKYDDGEWSRADF